MQKSIVPLPFREAARRMRFTYRTYKYYCTEYRSATGIGPIKVGTLHTDPPETRKLIQLIMRWQTVQLANYHKSFSDPHRQMHKQNQTSSGVFGQTDFEMKCFFLQAWKRLSSTHSEYKSCNIPCLVPLLKKYWSMEGCEVNQNSRQTIVYHLVTLSSGIRSGVYYANRYDILRHQGKNGILCKGLQSRLLTGKLSERSKLQYSPWLAPAGS